MTKTENNADNQYTQHVVTPNNPAINDELKPTNFDRALLLI